MPIAAVAALVLAEVADTRIPRGIVELRPPQGTELSASYLCPGTNVRLHVSAGYGWVKVTQYSAIDRSHRATALKTWNDALQKVALFSHFEISCQAENEQLIAIHGWSRTLGERLTWVEARFSGGRLVEVRGPK